MASALKTRLERGRNASGGRLFAFYFGLVCLAIGTGAAAWLLYLMMQPLLEHARTVLLILLFVPLGALTLALATSPPRPPVPPSSPPAP